MNHQRLASRILSAFVAASACVGLQAQSRDTGCRTGGAALADAYVLANPMYSYFLGELEPYLADHSEHFGANGDSVRCAAALARSFLGSAIQLYDPSDLSRREELNAQLGVMGISPGQQESSPSSQLYGVSLQLSRLARVLPAAAAELGCDGEIEVHSPLTILDAAELAFYKERRPTLRSLSRAAERSRALR